MCGVLHNDGGFADAAGAIGGEGRDSNDPLHSLSLFFVLSGQLLCKLAERVSFQLKLTVDDGTLLTFFFFFNCTVLRHMR